MQCCVNSKINKIPLVVKILVVSSRGIYVFLFFIHCRTYTFGCETFSSLWLGAFGSLSLGFVVNYKFGLE
jgi:hypothetical protein